MLCCSAQNLELINHITSIFANITTICGMVGLISAVISFFNNQVSARRLSLICEPIKNDFYKLTVINYTNKEFSIISISLLTDKKEYPAEELTVNSYRIDYEDKKHIPVYPFQSQDISCYFRLNGKSLPNSAMIRIKTTARKKPLTYKIKQKAKSK